MLDMLYFVLESANAFYEHFSHLLTVYLVFAATEIRCEEKSRGGMCYEVILAEPSADKPAPTVVSPRPKSMTAEEIAQKLMQAEERRKVILPVFQASINTS